MCLDFKFTLLKSGKRRHVVASTGHCLSINYFSTVIVMRFTLTQYKPYTHPFDKQYLLLSSHNPSLSIYCSIYMGCAKYDTSKVTAEPDHCLLDQDEGVLANKILFWQISGHWYIMQREYNLENHCKQFTRLYLSILIGNGKLVSFI